MVSPGAGGAVDQVGSLLAAAHQAVPLSGGLVDALVTVPVTCFVRSSKIIAFWLRQELKHC